MLRVERLNVTLSAGAVAASFAFLPQAVATGVAAGAAVEVLNFRALHGTARAFFSGDLGGPGMWMGVFGLRMAVVGAALAVAASFGVSPVGFAAGFSILMPALVFDAWRNRPPVLDQSDYPVPDPDDPSWDEFSVWRIEPAVKPEDELELDEQAAAEAPEAREEEAR